MLTRIIVSPAREQGAKIALGLDYFGLYYAYAIYNKKRNVEIGFPIQACFGFIHRERLVPGQMPERLKDAPVSLVETSVTAYLRIYRWLGIGGEAGYRFTIDPVDNIRNNLNSPIWHLGLKINLSYLYKDVFH